ncbi:MAG TPA: hypothetical protein VGI11_09790 [Variovorax sp.]
MNLLSRLRQFVMVSGVESFSVAVGGVAGLLIVNVVPKEQYAVYTFLITCMQLIIGITDLGLSKCALPIIGQRSSEVPWVMAVCGQIFRRRTLMLVLSFLIVVPYGAYTFVQHEWLEWAYVLAAGIVVLAVLTSLRAGFVNAVLLIIGQVTAISRISFMVTTIRFLLVGAVLLLPLTPYSIVFLLTASVVSEACGLLFYRREFQARGIREVRPGPADEKFIDGRILKIMVPLIPSSIFFHIQGSITIFLASLFGTSSTVAEMGAFGRLALALTIVDRVANILLFPAIARTSVGPRLVAMISKVHVSYLAIMLCVLMSSVLFPQYWILLLGSKYQNMVPYVWMVFLASILMNGAGLAFLTLAVRGFTEKQAWSVAWVILLQCAFLWKFGASDLPTILWFNIMTCGAHFIYQYMLLFLKVPELKKEQGT